MPWRLLQLFDRHVWTVPEPKPSDLLDNCYVFYHVESAFLDISGGKKQTYENSLHDGN